MTWRSSDQTLAFHWVLLNRGSLIWTKRLCMWLKMTIWKHCFGWVLVSRNYSIWGCCSSVKFKFLGHLSGMSQWACIASLRCYMLILNTYKGCEGEGLTWSDIIRDIQRHSSWGGLNVADRVAADIAMICSRFVHKGIYSILIWVSANLTVPIVDFYLFFYYSEVENGVKRSLLLRRGKFWPRPSILLNSKPEQNLSLLAAT